MEDDIIRILNALAGLVWTALADGQIDFVNQRWCEYTGLSLEEARGWGWRAAIHPEDLPALLGRWRSILVSGEPGEMEARLLRFDGEYRRFLISSNPLLDAAGQVVKWYGVSTEIEDRRRAEEALRARELDFRLIVDSIPAPVSVTTPSGEVEALNQPTLEYFGKSFEELKGWKTSEVVHPDDLHQTVAAQAEAHEAQLKAERELLDLAQKSARALAFDWHIQQEVNVWSPEQEALYGLRPGSFDGTFQGWKRLVYAPDWHVLLKAIDHAHETGVVAVEFRVQWPDGSLHWLATNGRMFFDAQGEPFRMVGFTIDVTPRKLAEEDLRRSEAFLGEAQRLSSTGSFSWRVATNRIAWSEQLYRIYELEVGAPVTLELIRTRVHPEDLTLYEKMVEQARNGGDDIEWQYRLLMPDRSIKYLHAVARATHDQDGELEYIAAVQDVTERRRSEEALGNLQSELAHVSRVATLGALTASIAHEINQPLSGIITNSSTGLRMLNADPPNVEGARETARRTLRDGNRASEVITRLRALFSKKEAATESVDLNEATREVIALSLSELRRSRVIPRLELANDLPHVTGDRVQLQQVILNLLRNALDAMDGVEDSRTPLVIRTERDGSERVRLSVRDAGVGFDPQMAGRLFDAFYTTKSDGMGIGLSVSRSIIESHQGRLWATPNDGPGTTFSFSIPCGPSA
ncbi:MAG: PAS domain-containing protein [Pyrinomonadaceae bacterium]